MKKRIIIFLTVIALVVAVFMQTVFAVPPSNPHIESGTADEGGRFFQYYADGIYRDLKTPPHWVAETGEVAYCLEHNLDSADGELYYTFDAEALYSNRTYNGLMAILMNGYPYNNDGLTNQQARYATANAIRSWLAESAGVGYLFMVPSRNALRYKSGYSSVWYFYKDLLEYAREGASAFPQYSITASPSTVALTEQYGELKGTVTVNMNNCSNYTINGNSLPSGSAISGCTGNSGDVLDITVPLDYKGDTITLKNIFIGNTNRGSVNFYWLDTSSSGTQSVVVPVVDAFTPVAYGSFDITSERPTEGYVEIYKTDVDTGSKLEGALFQIRDSNNDEVALLSTNVEGYAISDLLTEGIYSVREVSAPYGYVIDGTAIEDVEVIPEQTTTLNITNQPQVGTIRIVKNDTETGNIPQGDATLNGAVFEISDENGALVETLDCQDNNYVFSRQLPLGTYTITEVSAPIGYALNSSSQTITIEYSDQSTEVNNINVTVSNDVIKGSIQIQKTVDEPLAEWLIDGIDSKFSGVVFGITNSDGELVDTLTTDTNGLTASIPLPYGRYTITETIPMEGYYTADPFDVFIDEDGKVYEVEVQNEVIKSNVQILKTDAATGETIPIAGTEFQIFDIHNSPIVMNGTDTFTTDNTGTITLPEPLKYGRYTLHEVSPPYGYWLDNTPVTFFVDDNKDDIVIVEFSNIKIQKEIQVIKLDEKDDTPLAGAVFEVRKNNEVIDKLTTNADGTAVTGMLTAGNYMVVEVQAPTGYALDSNTFNVSITDDEEDIYTVLCTNAQTEVTLLKSDAATDEPLFGAVLEVYNSSNVLVYSGSTDSDGQVHINKLPVGSYYFKEVIAPDGYSLSPDIFKFQIHTNGDITGAIEVQNTHTEVILSKNDLIDGSALSDATVQVTDAADEVVFTGVSDVNGSIQIVKLPIGTYTFKEIEAPDGYILCENTLEFTIDEYGNITGETVISNCPTVLEISKVIYETEEPLSGAGFKIKNLLGLNILNFTKNDDGTFRYDKDGDIEEILVDENGKAIIYGLPFGNYWIEEHTVPTGYYPAAPLKITIDGTKDIENAYKAIVPNSEYVNLGLDRDRWHLPIAISLVGLLSFAIVLLLIFRKKRGDIDGQ